MTGRRCVESGNYRYVLSDDVGELKAAGTLLWCMLNPSTAGSDRDDPTSRKVAGFTRRLGFYRWSIVNLCALRATDPADLAAAASLGLDVSGPENLSHIQAEVASATMVIAAWGANASRDIVERVAPLLGSDVRCLGVTKSGQPRHPLYVPYQTPIVPWRLP